MASLSDRDTPSGSQPINIDRTFDVRGLSCPLPVLSTRKSVDSLQPGEVVKVIATDRGSISFFESLVRQTGLELLGWQEQNGEYQFFLQKN